MSAEISFFMENYETLCFNDVLAKNTLIVIKTRSKSNQYKFTLLYSEDTQLQEKIISIDSQVEILFDYTTNKNGNYFFCFEDLLGLYNEIYFEYLVGAETNDLQEIAQIKDLDQIQELVKNIQAKLEFMKQQLIIFTSTKTENILFVENLYSQIIKSDSFGVIVILILNVLEVVIIKRNFLRKKNQ